MEECKICNLYNLEETIAKDNLSRILVDVPEKKDEKEEKKTDDENK